MYLDAAAVRRFRAGALIPLSALLVAAVLPARAADPRAPRTTVRQVVMSISGSLADAADAVRRVGGHVDALLPLAGAVAAELPAGADLGREVVVLADRSVTVAGKHGRGDDDAANDRDDAEDDTGTRGGDEADAAPLPRSSVRDLVGLGSAGAPTGAGVTVAIVDTGVADVADLAGQVVRRVNTSDGPAGDGYGHGTFMAGLVAGTGERSAGRFVGVAPRARILDVKVAGADGTTSLSNVLRGLEAVAADGSVRVVSLSLSAPTPLPYFVDPLTRALDALWARGVTVVVPAGNDGPGAATLSSPGTDPNLLTVGGLDTADAADRGDDQVAAWSARGPAPMGFAKPDLVAPGQSIVSVRAPGSQIDRDHAAGRVDDDYFRGSGTSMSTAVVAGAAAALLSEHPDLTPDEIKGLLRATAHTGRGLRDRHAAGAGALDARAAVAAAGDAARYAVAAVGTLAAGDALPWERFVTAVLDGDDAGAAHSWSELSAAARSWAARSWAARSWAGTQWSARSWAAWSARSWSDQEWAARSWVGAEWTARSWSARSWSARSWSARSWSAEDWSARSWSARSWSMLPEA